MKQSKTLRRWELALLLGVACAALLGVWLDGAQAALSDQVIRLHVLANSDSEADQALKLRVRDRILAEAEELFVPGAGRAETEELLRAHLYDLAAAGAEVVGEAGYSYPVTASLVHDYWFPTKTYTDFALPGRAYTALRIEIGAGGGQNWWCVVFPPLCLGSVSETTQETALEAGLTENQVSLMTGEDEGYVVKFKAVELLEQFKGWLEGAIKSGLRKRAGRFLRGNSADAAVGDAQNPYRHGEEYIEPGGDAEKATGGPGPAQSQLGPGCPSYPAQSRCTPPPAARRKGRRRW